MLLHGTAVLSPSVPSPPAGPAEPAGTWAPGVKWFISARHLFKMSGCPKLNSGCYRKEKVLLWGMLRCLGKEMCDTVDQPVDVQTLKMSLKKKCSLS